MLLIGSVACDNWHSDEVCAITYTRRHSRIELRQFKRLREIVQVGYIKRGCMKIPKRLQPLLEDGLIDEVDGRLMLSLIHI